MKMRAVLMAGLVLPGVFHLFLGNASAAVRETAEDAQIDVLVLAAKTKADHLKIAAMYNEEAKAEAAKAKSLRDQAEAYRTHRHDVYSRNIYDLVEHTEAIARSYQEASDRHKSLADIHAQMAADRKPE